MKKDVLVEEVVNQIRKDFESGDTTSLFVLLYNIPTEDLISFLPEKNHESWTN